MCDPWMTSLFLLEVEIWALRLGLRPGGWDFGLKERILALRIGVSPLEGDLGLEAEIWAFRREFGP